MAITRLSLLYAFLTFALTAISQAPTCEELAKQAGKPTDGWKTITDSNGDQQCRRVTVDEMCLGQQYTDPTPKDAPSAGKVSGKYTVGVKDFLAGVWPISRYLQAPTVLDAAANTTADPQVAGAPSCCSPPHTVTWTDKANGVGHCCPAGHSWTGSGTAGGCCVTGQVWTNGKCKAPPPTQPGDGDQTPMGGPDDSKPKSPDDSKPKSPDDSKPKSPDDSKPKNPDDSKPKSPDDSKPKSPDDSKPKSPDDSKPKSPDDSKPKSPDDSKPKSPDDSKPKSPDDSKPKSPDDSSPKSPDGDQPNSCCGGCGGGMNRTCGPCGGTPVCGNSTSLGIQYGHCYILSFGDGQQLGAQRDSPLHTYAKGGTFQDIPFKVCKLTTDCADHGAVPVNGTFVLQDQNGMYDDPTGALGFINNAVGGGHMSFTSALDQAGVFIGSPACANGECAVKMRGVGLNNMTLSVGPACPADTPGITFWPNPRMGINLRFTEIRCDDAPRTVEDKPTATGDN